MNVLIVDDEPLARSVLRSFLAQDPDITRIDECSNGTEAVRRLSEVRFDLLFLDVRMPDLDGFGVLGESDSDDQPIVIIVTAFEEHALKAFSVAALDYLLKPFDDQRFAVALDRAKQRFRERSLTKRGHELAELLGTTLGPALQRDERIAIDSGGNVQRVDLSRVTWIEAQDKHVLFHADEEGPIRARKTLNEVEQLLDPRRFLRVHRSCIVALPRVVSLEKTEGGAAYAVMDSDARVVVSRSRLPIVRARLRGATG